MKWAAAPKKRTLILLVFALVLVITAAVVIKEKNKSSQAGKAAQLQSMFEANDKAALSRGDIVTYLNDMVTYGKAYMDAHDYKGAAAVVNNIKKNVPDSNWDTDTYILLAQVAKAQGKTADYKNYTNKLIAQFKAGGDSEEAQYYQKQLQSN